MGLSVPVSFFWSDDKDGGEMEAVVRYKIPHVVHMQGRCL